MGDNTIVANEFFKISYDSDGIYIETYKRGFPMEQISALLIQHPEIGITSLNVLRNSIALATGKPEKFGEIKEPIQLELSENDTVAIVVFNMSETDLDYPSRESLVKRLYELLNSKGIIYGLKKDILAGELKSGKPYVVAQGSLPVNGTDAAVRLYEMQEARPKVQDDERVDYYELKLINRVNVGDWLGERIEATDGIPGKTVRGAEIRPVKGRTVLLNYDRNSVQEVYTNDKTTLYARINGAVTYSNGRLEVSNHLEVDGDVGLQTGNLKFDGFVTVKGTICDGFSVEATKDIEINSLLGLGSIKSLVSSGGSIFVRGGISPKVRTEIKAAKSIFIKFVDNTDVICGGIAHIGYYCMNSSIKAKEVIFDSSKGQVIGGQIKAEIKVTVPIIGTESERRTTIEVTGFNRQVLLENMDGIFRKIGELKNEQQKLRQKLTGFDSAAKLDPFKRKEFNDTNDRLYELRDEIRNLEEERKNNAEYLKARGEGEISATRKIYPNCVLNIKGDLFEVSEIMPPTVFYAVDSELKRI